MTPYIFLLLSFFSEADSPKQKNLIAYHGGPVRINYFKNKNDYKEYKSGNDDVHVKLSITNSRLGDLTTEQLKNRITIEFIDSLGNSIPNASLGYVHNSKKTVIKKSQETADLEPGMSLRSHNSVLDVTIPIRRRIIREWGESVVGYRFPVGRCSIRITVQIGEDKQELLVPLIIR